MNDPMTILRADHRHVKQLLTKLAASDEGAERTAMCTELEQALTVHMDLEERLVYPLVTAQVGEEDSEEAQIEHDLARTALATMVAMADKPGFGAAVEMLKAGIEHHVDEEESELLPALKEGLERADWLALGDSIAEGKEAAGLPDKPTTRRRSSKRSTSRRSSGSATKASSR